MKIRDSKLGTTFSIVRSFPALPTVDEQKKEIRAYLSDRDFVELGVLDVSTPVRDIGNIFLEEKILEVRPDVVITWRLDCVTREMASFLEFCKWLCFLSEQNVTFISVKDNVWFDAENLSVVSHLVSLWSTSRRRLRVENAFMSRAKARTKGSKLGRKKRRDDETIRKLRREGRTIRAIAKATGVSTTAVQRALHDYPGTHRPEDDASY